MPKSLRCEIKHLCHNGTLTERERDRILKALEHEDALEKIRAEINTMPCAITSMREIYVNRDKVINIIDKYRKGGVE